MKIVIEIDDKNIETEVKRQINQNIRPLIKNLVDKNIDENKILDTAYYETYHSILGEIIRNIVIEELKNQRIIE